MEDNEKMELEVIETPETIVEENSNDVIKTAAGAGLIVLGGIAAYKYIYKPIKAKVKAKKEKTIIEEEVIIVDADVVESEDDSHEEV